MPDVSCDTVLHLARSSACFLLSSYHTSVCSIKLNAKVSIGATGIVAGGENDASDGFVFPDHTGDGRCGHYPVVSDDQTTHLRKMSHGDVSAGWDECISRHSWVRRHWEYQQISGLSQLLLEVNRTIFHFINSSYGTPRAGSVMCKCILNPSKYIIYPSQLSDTTGSSLEHFQHCCCVGHTCPKHLTCAACCIIYPPYKCHLERWAGKLVKRLNSYCCSWL